MFSENKLFHNLPWINLRVLPCSRAWSAPRFGLNLIRCVKYRHFFSSFDVTAACCNVTKFTQSLSWYHFTNIDVSTVFNYHSVFRFLKGNVGEHLAQYWIMRNISYGRYLHATSGQCLGLRTLEELHFFYNHKIYVDLGNKCHLELGSHTKQLKKN